MVGYRAGNYEDRDTEEKLVLWTKMGTGLRLLTALGAIVLIGLGIGVGFLE